MALGRPLMDTVACRVCKLSALGAAQAQRQALHVRVEPLGHLRSVAAESRGSNRNARKASATTSGERCDQMHCRRLMLRCAEFSWTATTGIRTWKGCSVGTTKQKEIRRTQVLPQFHPKQKQPAVHPHVVKFAVDSKHSSRPSSTKAIV